MSEELPVISPFDQRQIDSIFLNSEEDIEYALAEVSHAAHNRSYRLPLSERIKILKEASQLLKSRQVEFAQLIAQDGGKPINDSLIEAQRAVDSIDVAISEIYHLHGDIVPMGLNVVSQHKTAYTRREPVGVVIAISAFNHPLNLIVHQTVTAIAAGCTVIVKPDLRTPLCAINFVDLLYQAGLSERYCKVILCGDHLAEKLVTDHRVNCLNFIGSAKVGWSLRSKLRPGTHCILEHGGVAPVIVTNPHFPNLIPKLLSGAFYHAGQVCVSVQRIFIHKQYMKRFSDELAEAADALVVGDPLDHSTDVGPLILPREVKRIHGWVQEAVDNGAEALCGGEPIEDTLYKPTVLLDPPSNSRVVNEEIFGPVVSIIPFDSFDSAVKKANALPYSFQASVFTSDIDVALRMTEALDATSVIINDHSAFRVDWMPFGGRKLSGLGTGGIGHTMKALTYEKLVVLSHTPERLT